MMLKEKAQTSPLRLNLGQQDHEFDCFDNCVTPTKAAENKEDEEQ